MKHLFLLVFCGLLLTACDPELTYSYSVENIGLEDIIVTASPDYFDIDSLNIEHLILPGELKEISNYFLVGTTDDFEEDPIYISGLMIENEAGVIYNKDPLDASLWSTEVVSKGEGKFLLKISDEDF